MNADQAVAVAQALGQQIQQEWMTTVKVLEAIPEDKKSYKPDPKGRSAWELAVHLCLADVWFLNGVLKQDFTPHGEDAPAETVSGLVDWYKHEMPKALEHVLALDGSKLAAIGGLLRHEDAERAIPCVSGRAQRASPGPARNLSAPDGLKSTEHLRRQR